MSKLNIEINPFSHFMEHFPSLIFFFIKKYNERGEEINCSLIKINSTCSFCVVKPPFLDICIMSAALKFVQ